MCFVNPKASGISLVDLSVLLGTLTGSIIGTFFMALGIITKVYGTIFIFAGLHSTGGLIGGALGLILIKALELGVIFAIQT